MNIFNSPVARRTRLQWQLLYSQVSGGSCRSKRRAVSETKRVDELEEEKSSENGSKGSSRSTRRRLNETKKDKESLVDESEEEENNENASEGSSVLRIRHDEAERVNEIWIDDSEEETDNENASNGSSISRIKGHDEAERFNEILLDDSEEETDNENGSSILRRSHDEAERVTSDTLLDDSEEQTKNENASESSILSGKGHEEAKWVDDDELFVEDSKGKSNNENGSGGTSRSNSILMTSNKHGEYSVDESQEKGSDEEESHHSMKETDGDKEKNNMESPKIAMKHHDYGSASFFKTGTHTYFLYSSDDSDSDDTAVIPDEEEADEDLPISRKYHQEIQNLSSEDDEDEPSSSSESESDNLDNFENMKESPTKNTREKIWSGSVDRREKNHSTSKTYMKKPNLKPMNDSTMRINTHEKTNAKVKESDHYKTVDKANAIKNQESLKPRKAPRKDDGVFVESLLDSIIENGEVHHKEGDNCLPLRFRFDDSEDESSSQKNDEMEGLFQEMDFAFTCEEIGSYTTPTVKNREKDVDETETNPFKQCQKGEHRDAYFEEQIGFRCGICGAIILESRYVIPKLANYAPDKSKRSYHYNEQQFSTSENMYFEAPDCNPLDIYKKSKGTVWELIPTSIRAHLYHHQQEGFKFLWKNLAGTIELSRIHKLDPRGGGCIISHAPGTGKTLLTIVFLESFLKKFPKCLPVIVAPVSMLLTWEAEFKKWQVGFSFLNLNSSDILSKDKVNNAKLKCSKDLIRAMKISCWSNGGSVLGVSYNLYEKLAGNTKNKNLEKMGDVLLEKPGLVILDEGHTPRNERSNIWNVLKKLKTKNRVILSGTPFQNNFRELFNTLHLVRPSTAKDIMNQKIFAEMMIRYRNKKKSRSESAASGDIEKLKAIISPFVHVHKGKILESKLLGLKSSVILLNPPPLQKRLIKNLGSLAKTFEYEHKVALVSVHPSLILHCSLSEKEKNSINKQELKKVKLKPDFGVKTRFVTELIRLSMSLDEKVLIFSQFIEPLKLLKDQIALVFGWNEGREMMIIEGRILQKQRQTIINNFNDPNSEVKVLLASTRCCSEGIHLIGASRVVLLDVVWNPSVERQAISRAYRLGQKKVVYTYHLMASGTTEEEKYHRQVEKERLGELVFSSSAMASEELKNNDKVHATKLNDKILQQMVDHQELNTMFKEIRYPEKHTTI
ncbi:SNF2 domain-containing protein CLASSY 3 isoform X2 [Lactuca sativa]|uniref:SNF2 domain-containing protein CLASSY 3 isoform X2 n=1 Tax=Lactuca sativa TaxID=4236 RepID=UPI001C6921D4|nr:SNF2 domain-containing protein CLASSY 3 isoform X2 [Lactuca sativa]